MWRCVVVVVVTVALAWPGAGAASAAPPDETPAPVETGEISKTECFARHEQAQTARRERRLLEARAALQTCSRASCPAAIRNDCVDWLDQVGRSLPSVVVTARARGADEADVKVFIDGRLVTERLSGAALDVDPGEHRFRFESPRWPAIERTVLVSEGVKDRSIDVEFAPPPAPQPAAILKAPEPPAPPAERGWDRLDYVVGGAAAASLGASAYLGGWALLQRDRLMNSCAPFCSGDQTSEVHNKLVAADVALGVTAACLIVLYLRVTRTKGAN